MNQPRTARDRVDRVFAIGRRTGRFVVPALVVAVLGSAGALTYAQLHRRMYKSEAVLRYRDAARAAALGGDDPEERASRLVARLRQTALSRSQLEQIITVSRIYGDTIADRGMADAVEEMRGHITFRPIDGETFGLGFEGHDPTRARDVTARLAEALVAESAPAAASDPATPAPQPVQPVQAPPTGADRERLEKELKVKQAAVSSFLAKHPEFTRESQGGPPPPRPVIRPVTPNKNDTTLATLERETARLEERLAQPVAHAVTATKEEVQAETALVAAKSAADNELAAAQKDLADKLGKFTDEHPDVHLARERLAAAQEKAKHADEAVNANLAAAQQRSQAKQEDEGYIDRGALENQLRRINEEIAEYKRHKESAAALNTQVATSVVALENDWLRLARDLSDARERLTAAREAEAKAAPATGATTATGAATASAEAAPAVARNAALVVVDPAYLPGHEEFPGRNQIMVAGVAASLLLGFFLALLLAILDDRVYDRVDIERLGVPLLSVVPRAGSNVDPMVKLG